MPVFLPELATFAAERRFNEGKRKEKGTLFYLYVTSALDKA